MGLQYQLQTLGVNSSTLQDRRHFVDAEFV